MQTHPIWILSVGLVIYGIGVLLGVFLLAAYPLSLAYPVVVGLSLTALAVLSGIVLSEPIGPTRVAGTAFVIVGVYLMVREQRSRADRA